MDATSEENGRSTLLRLRITAGAVAAVLLLGGVAAWQWATSVPANVGPAGGLAAEVGGGLAGDEEGGPVAAADRVVAEATGHLAAAGDLGGYRPSPDGNHHIEVAGRGQHLAVAVAGGEGCAAGAIIGGQPQWSATDPSGQACRPGAVELAVAAFDGGTEVRGDGEEPSLITEAQGERRLLRAADAARFAAQQDYRDGRPTLERFTIAALDDPEMRVVAVEHLEDGGKVRLTVETEAGCRAVTVTAGGTTQGPTSCR